MRYSGPRILFLKPSIAFSHLYHNTIIIRYLFILLGWFFIFLAALGVVLPGLPTTPFILLAAYLFARSSERFHIWLSGHKIFGPIISNWERDKSIPRKSKYLALGSIIITGGISLFVIKIAIVRIILFVILISVSIFLFSLAECE